MRVISGKLKGRSIKGHDLEGTRPTMDRVKESLFAMIQNNLKDSIVLDLFAGSGNLGIEAISNGCNICYFNDYNIKAINAINDNIKAMNIMEQCVVLKMDYNKCLDYFDSSTIKFDIIFLDPPYKMECINEIIGKIIDKKLLNKEGLIICESSSDYIRPDERLELIKDKKYGDKKITIFKNKIV